MNKTMNKHFSAALIHCFSRLALPVILCLSALTACGPQSPEETPEATADLAPVVYPAEMIMPQAREAILMAKYYTQRKPDFTQYNLYLSDEFLNISEDSVAAVLKVVNNQFTYALQIDRLRAGRLRPIEKDGKVSSHYIDFFLVPGETTKVDFWQRVWTEIPFYHVAKYSDHTENFINRYVWHLRHVADWRSPHTPQVEGKCWEQPENDVYDVATDRYKVRQVFFSPQETVVRLTALDIFAEPVVSSNCYLVDEKGKIYSFRRIVHGTIDGDFGPEASVYGAYYAFDPLPETTTVFSFYMGDKSMTAVMNVHEREIKPEKPQNPNFHLTVDVTPGLMDQGYLIYTGPNKYETFHTGLELEAKEGKCDYECHLEGPKWMCLQAYFADRSICSAYISMPIVPGERAKLVVQNGFFDLDGTPFYHQWNRASYLSYNADLYHDKQLADSLLLDYLRAHGSEEGCAVFYQANHKLPQDTIFKYVPQTIREGRFKPFF